MEFVAVSDDRESLDLTTFQTVISSSPNDCVDLIQREITQNQKISLVSFGPTTKATMNYMCGPSSVFTALLSYYIDAQIPIKFFIENSTLRIPEDKESAFCINTNEDFPIVFDKIKAFSEADFLRITVFVGQKVIVLLYLPSFPPFESDATVSVKLNGWEFLQNPTDLIVPKTIVVLHFDSSLPMESETLRIVSKTQADVADHEINEPQKTVELRERKDEDNKSEASSSVHRHHHRHHKQQREPNNNDSRISNKDSVAKRRERPMRESELETMSSLVDNESEPSAFTQNSRRTNHSTRSSRSKHPVKQQRVKGAKPDQNNSELDEIKQSDHVPLSSDEIRQSEHIPINSDEISSQRYTSSVQGSELQPINQNDRENRAANRYDSEQGSNANISSRRRKNEKLDDEYSFDNDRNDQNSLAKKEGDQLNSSDDYYSYSYDSLDDDEDDNSSRNRTGKVHRATEANEGYYDSFNYSYRQEEEEDAEEEESLEEKIHKFAYDVEFNIPALQDNAIYATLFRQLFFEKWKGGALNRAEVALLSAQEHMRKKTADELSNLKALVQSGDLSIFIAREEQKLRLLEVKTVETIEMLMNHQIELYSDTTMHSLYKNFKVLCSQQIEQQRIVREKRADIRSKAMDLRIREMKRIELMEKRQKKESKLNQQRDRLRAALEKQEMLTEEVNEYVDIRNELLAQKEKVSKLLAQKKAEKEKSMSRRK